MILVSYTKDLIKSPYPKNTYRTISRWVLYKEKRTQNGKTTIKTKIRKKIRPFAKKNNKKNFLFFFDTKKTI